MRQDKNHLSKIDRFRSTQKEDFNNEKSYIYLHLGAARNYLLKTMTDDLQQTLVVKPKSENTIVSITSSS